MASLQDFVKQSYGATQPTSTSITPGHLSDFVEASKKVSFPEGGSSPAPQAPQFKSDPSTTDTVPPPQNFFQKSATAIGNKASDIWSSLIAPKQTSPVFQAPVGQGLSPTDQVKAQQTLTNAENAPQAGTQVKLPFIDAGFTIPGGNDGSDPGISAPGQILKGLIETPEKATRTLTELASGVEGKTPTGTNRENTHSYFTPSYSEVAGKTTGELMDTLQAQGMDINAAKPAAVVLASASAAGSFANDALIYLDPLAREGGVLKSTALDDALTKNVIKTTTPESVKYFNTNQVKDIWQTGKVLTDADKENILTAIGGDKAALKNAIQNGISIKVPESTITTLEDKPYWAKIKGAFGIDPSTPKLIASDVKIPVQTVRGYLQEAGVAHPSDLHQPEGAPYSVNKAEINNPDNAHLAQVKEEASQMLQAGHSTEEVSAQLQKELNTPKGVADTITHEVHQETLNNISEQSKPIENTSIPTASLTSKAALSGDYQPARASSVAQVYKAGDIKDGNYIQGIYDGKPYTTNAHILEFNNDLSDIKGLTPSKSEAPTEAAIHRLIPDGGTKLSVDNVKTTGTKDYVNLKSGDLDIHVDRKYFDYLKKKYPEADFVGTQPQKPIKVIEDGKLKALLMPNTIDLSKAPESWNKKHTEGLSTPQTPVKIPEELSETTNAGEQPRGPMTLNAELIPGLSKFITDDVAPRIKGAAGTTKSVFKEISTLFNPVGQAPSEGVDILMKRKGEFEKEMFNLEQATKEIKKMWDKQPEQARMDFISNVEQGKEVPSEFKDLADMYRARLDNAYKAIEQFKDLPFIENFFPHFWEKPDEITQNVIAKMQAKKPLQGTRSFLKQRVFSTIQEGIDAGYKAVSTNPEQLTQLYEQNVKKFVMAQLIKSDMIDKGLWKFFKHGEKIPDGMARIDDAIAKIYFPVKTEAGGTVITSGGEYYAQQDVARLINNYLSKDRIMDTVIGRGLMNLKNTLNVFQLGFSAFHLTMETLDSMVSKFGVGLSQLSQGKIIDAIGNMAGAPLAPIKYFRDGQKFFNGDPTMKSIEDALFTGGASFREKQYYKNTILDKFLTNIREGNYIGAILRLPIATIEATMRPLFGYYIPRLKVGAFRQLYSEELSRNASKIASGEMTQETIARQTWANIENRMGELNYDNLFWNRNLKASMMLTFRAVGWNLGTARELGGAFLQDLPKAVKGAATGKGFDFTPKMQYTLALFTLMGAVGATYGYLHTGKGPKSVKDLYYPKNGATNAQGDAQRIEFPTYLKDAYQITHSPVTTVGNKLSPEFSAIVDLLTNKDFYGDYIRNVNDKTPTQAKQIALFLASQLTPFSFSQIQKQKEGNSTTEQQVESFLGIVNAPAAVVQSAYEKQLQEIYSEQRGAYGPRTPEQKEIDDAKSKAKDKIKKGDYSDLIKLEQEGIITPRGANTFIKNTFKTTAEKEYQQLNAQRKARANAAKL